MEQLAFDDNIYDTIRRNIKKYRREKKMTAAELAELVGRSHDFIRQIRGKNKSQTWAILAKYFVWKERYS